jgi:hypothetical protein
MVCSALLVSVLVVGATGAPASSLRGSAAPNQLGSIGPSSSEQASAALIALNTTEQSLRTQKRFPPVPVCFGFPYVDNNCGDGAYGCYPDQGCERGSMNGCAAGGSPEVCRYCAKPGGRNTAGYEECPTEPVKPSGCDNPFVVQPGDTCWSLWHLHLCHYGSLICDYHIPYCCGSDGGSGGCSGGMDPPAGNTCTIGR